MKTSLLLLASIVVACSDAPQPAAKPQIAFVTNGVGPFWTIAVKGVEAAAAEFAADAEVQIHTSGMARFLCPNDKRKICIRSPHTNVPSKTTSTARPANGANTGTSSGRYNAHTERCPFDSQRRSRATHDAA